MARVVGEGESKVHAQMWGRRLRLHGGGTAGSEVLGRAENPRPNDDDSLISCLCHNSTIAFRPSQAPVQIPPKPSLQTSSTNRCHLTLEQNLKNPIGEKI
ncbi:hypothetical protein L484_009280 [Morus notabilis]|uniref:Uncharacterized protein n=1 Tax=Morus notabilis TaxID=981085 RepID=W9RLW7_9ROSA|nr:hypothetical protein L484_009280 [Morus notabilis]